MHQHLKSQAHNSFYNFAGLIYVNAKNESAKTVFFVG